MAFWRFWPGRGADLSGMAATGGHYDDLVGHRRGRSHLWGYPFLHSNRRADGAIGSPIRHFIHSANINLGSKDVGAATPTGVFLCLFPGGIYFVRWLGTILGWLPSNPGCHTDRLTGVGLCLPIHWGMTMRKILIFFAILSFLPIVLGSCDAVEDMGEDAQATQGQNEATRTQPTVTQTINTPPSTPLQTDSEGIEYAPISIYVSPHGSDDNDGSSREQAFASVKRALESAQAGDVVLISEGVYGEGIELEDLIGPIIIIGEGDVALDGERKTRMGIWCENCSNITFDNLTFRNYTDVGIGVHSSDQIVMRNLIVHNNGFAVQLVEWEFEGYGIMVDDSSNVLVEYNVVYENGPNPQIIPDFIMGTVNTTGFNTFKNIQHGY